MYNIYIDSVRKTVTITDKVYYRNTTNPNIAVLVTIVKADTDQEKGRDVTGKDGIYEITIPLLSMPSGTYEIRFYGSNTRPFLIPKGDWISFTFINPLNLEAIRFKETPTLQVSEGITRIDVNGNEKTEVNLDLMNLETVTGTIAYVEFYYKKTIENDSKWRILESFAFSQDLDNVGDFTEGGGTLVNCRSVSLSASDLAVAYDEDGDIIDASPITITAEAINTVGTVYYEFLVNSVSVQNTISNTYSYYPPSAYEDMPESIEIRIRELTNTGTVEATDTFFMLGLKEGTHTITTNLSNSIHSIPSDFTGNNSIYTGSGTDIKVWEGAEPLRFDSGGISTFSISKTASNITPGTESLGGGGSGVNEHIVIDPLNVHHFMYENGARFFPFGDTCYYLLSESTDVITAYLNSRAAQGFNFIRVLAVGGDFWPFGGTPASPDFNTHDSVAMAKMDWLFDTAKSKNINLEVIIFGYGLSGGQGMWGNSTLENNWIDYLVNRYKDRTNLFMWTVTNEFERYSDGNYTYASADVDWAKAKLTRIAGIDSTHARGCHPSVWITDHPNNGGSFDSYDGETQHYPLVTWPLWEDSSATVYATQNRHGVQGNAQITYEGTVYAAPVWSDLTGLSDESPGLENAIQEDWMHYPPTGKPVLNTEMGYQYEAGTGPGEPMYDSHTLWDQKSIRIKAWKTTVAGGYFAAGFVHQANMAREPGYIYPMDINKINTWRPEHLKILYDFFTERTEYWKRLPQISFVDDFNICGGVVGEELVAYFPRGCDGDYVHLAVGTWNINWLNPRTGAYTSGGTRVVSVEGNETFTAPSDTSNDWVLHLTISGFEQDDPGIPGSGIEYGGGDYYTYSIDDHSNITDDTAFISYDISIITSSGTQDLVSRSQTFVREKAYIDAGAQPGGPNENTEAQFKSSIFLENKPTDYDFYCVFFNPLMQTALEEDEVTVLKIYDRQVTFNGVPDLQEYVEVINLRATNALNTEQGSLPSMWADLEWTNLKELPNSALYFPMVLRNGFNGAGTQITYKIAQHITAYGVWMYVTDENIPPPTLSGFENPFPAEFPGWYFMGDFATPNASIKCPATKWVGFWVGMKTRQTEKLKGLYGEGIPKSKFIEEIEE